MMGDVRPYDPSAPAAAAVDLEKYPLKLAKVAMDPSKKGWERFRVTLSNEVRSMYVDDAIHSPKWKDLVLDFDRKLLGSSSISYPLSSYDFNGGSQEHIKGPIMSIFPSHSSVIPGFVVAPRSAKLSSQLKTKKRKCRKELPLRRVRNRTCCLPCWTSTSWNVALLVGPQEHPST